MGINISSDEHGNFEQAKALCISGVGIFVTGSGMKYPLLSSSLGYPRFLSSFSLSWSSSKLADLLELDDSASKSNVMQTTEMIN